MTHKFSRLLPAIACRLAVMALAAVALSACATRPSDPAALAAYQENNDSLEPLNRSMLKVDDGLKTVLVGPILKGYRAVVPEQGRKSVVNFMHNLHSPITFVHDVLQGNIHRAGETIGRLGSLSASAQSRHRLRPWRVLRSGHGDRPSSRSRVTTAWRWRGYCLRSRPRLAHR